MKDLKDNKSRDTELDNEENKLDNSKDLKNEFNIEINPEILNNKNQINNKNLEIPNNLNNISDLNNHDNTRNSQKEEHIANNNDISNTDTNNTENFVADKNKSEKYKAVKTNKQDKDNESSSSEPYSFDYSRLYKENDYTTRKKQPYLKRIFNGKNSIIFALIALAFIFLNIYRLNDPLIIGSEAPNLILTSKNGESFDINKIYSSKVLIFYKKHTYFSNYIFNTTYKRALPAFKILQDQGLAQVIVISEGYDTVEELSKLLSLEEYTYLENIMFATDTSMAGRKYGIRSWPHLYVISKDNKVIYETKLGSADKVQQILWRDY